VRSIANAVKRSALVAFVVLLTGCATTGSPPQGSVSSCYQFALAAVRHHVTVTRVPPACRGLSQTNVNEAVERALRTAAYGTRGRTQLRAVIASDDRYLAGLTRAVRGSGGTAAPPAATGGALSGGGLRLAALVAWLVTAALGLAMLVRWIGPAWRRGTRPMLNIAHLGLAIAGLLTWVGYLFSDASAVAWVAWSLLFVAVGLGMALLFITVGGSANRRRVLIATHIAGAVITLLLAVFAVII
jgi:hypothetical protein